MDSFIPQSMPFACFGVAIESPTTSFSLHLLSVKKNLLLSVSMQRVENDRDFFRTRLLTALFSVQAYMPKFVVISNFKNTPQYVHTHASWQQTERTRRNRICTGL